MDCNFIVDRLHHTCVSLDRLPEHHDTGVVEVFAVSAVPNRMILQVVRHGQVPLKSSTGPEQAPKNIQPEMLLAFRTVLCSNLCLSNFQFH